MAEISLAVLVVVLIVLFRVLRRLVLLERDFRDPSAVLGPVLEQKHREMLKDLHEGLAQQGDRLGRNLVDSSERLSARIDQRLDQIAGKVDERLEEGFKRAFAEASRTKTFFPKPFEIRKFCPVSTAKYDEMVSAYIEAHRRGESTGTVVKSAFDERAESKRRKKEGRRESQKESY